MHRLSVAVLAVAIFQRAAAVHLSPMTMLATLESRINEPSRRQQRGIEYSDDEGSQQAAGNEPPAIQISPSPPEPRYGPFQIGFLFQVGDFAGQWPAGATGANENIPSPHHRAKTTLK